MRLRRLEPLHITGFATAQTRLLGIAATTVDRRSEKVKRHHKCRLKLRLNRINLIVADSGGERLAVGDVGVKSYGIVP